MAIDTLSPHLTCFSSIVLTNYTTQHCHPHQLCLQIIFPHALTKLCRFFWLAAAILRSIIASLASITWMISPFIIGYYMLKDCFCIRFYYYISTKFLLLTVVSCPIVIPTIKENLGCFTLKDGRRCCYTYDSSQT